MFYFHVFSFPFSPSILPLQTLREVNELQHNLREGNSEYCCVNNHEIMIEYSFFDEDHGGPLAAARAIFV